MAARADNQAVAFSEKVFERLLAAYPKAHREEYGTAMAQLFRDQCRDAWNESRSWGLTKFWLRVLPEVLVTSFSEHLEAVRERTFMRNRIAMVFRSRGLYRIPPVFTTVFLLVVIPITIHALVQRKSYGSFAWLHVRSGNVQAECEFVRSDAVLNKVIATLDLNTEWGKKLQGKEKLQIRETSVLLRKMLVVEISNKEPVITLGVLSDKPDEAVSIANAVLETYLSERRKPVNIPPGQPSNAEIKVIGYPNGPIPQFHKLQDIANGVVMGGLLGWIASAGVSGISFLIRRFFTPKIAF
jgi:hypothetical protein